MTLRYTERMSQSSALCAYDVWTALKAILLDLCGLRVGKKAQVHRQHCPMQWCIGNSSLSKGSNPQQR